MLARNLPKIDKLPVISIELKYAKITENASEQVGRNINCKTLFSLIK